MSTTNPGDLVRISAAFTNSAGSAADPTTVTFLMREQHRSDTTYVYATDNELVKDSTGNYHVDWTVAHKGRHRYRWTGTGAVQTVEEGEFTATSLF